MASEWIIDGFTKSQGTNENNDRFVWVLKGTNQFVTSFKQLFDSSSSTSMSDEDEEPTIEFLSVKEAIITIGSQKFAMTHVPVDYLVSTN